MNSLLIAGFVLLSVFQLPACSFIMASQTTSFTARSENLFAGNLLPLILGKRSSENVVYSPASIHSCLALTYLGAEGQTAAELRKVLNFEEEDKSAFAAEYGNLLETLLDKNNNEDSKPLLKMGNRLYVSNKIKILEEFNRLARKSFGSEAENVDFNQSSTAVARINQWVEDQTENKIKNLLQKDSVDGQTTSVLVNTFYFKARWLHPFIDSLTEKKVFHINSTKQVKVDTMYTEDSFRYGELNDINAKVLEMSYANTNMSMLVILPNEIEGLEKLEKNLEGRDLSEISGKLELQTVQVYFPKFRIEFDIYLKEILQKMGCSSMFATNANLSGMFDSETPQRISEIKHKAYLDCDENGSEAAAATYMQIVAMSLNMYPKIFHADHPFAFFIRNENAVYFAGHVAQFED